MSIKVLFRTVVFLAILFTMLYIGLNNRQTADFYFPGVIDKKLTTDAALIYFGMFAAGVIAGTLLTAGGGGGKAKAAGKTEK
jgi:preprotein translocase subunit SecG